MGVGSIPVRKESSSMIGSGDRRLIQTDDSEIYIDSKLMQIQLLKNFIGYAYTEIRLRKVI